VRPIFASSAESAFLVFSRLSDILARARSVTTMVFEKPSDGGLFRR
jgi:hypothetical protein